MSLSFESLIDDDSPPVEKPQDIEDFASVLESISSDADAVVKEEINLLDLVNVTDQENECTLSKEELAEQMDTGQIYQSSDTSSNFSDNQIEDDWSHSIDKDSENDGQSPMSLVEVLHNLSSLTSDTASDETIEANVPHNWVQLLFPTLNSTHGLLCKVCNTLFSTKSALVNHMKVHSRESKPEKISINMSTCFICGKLVRNLAGHLKLHLRLYRCFCGKAFHKEAKLEDHYRTHTGERPFKCPVCSKCFAVKHNLGTHMKYHEEKQYVCAICYKKFITQSYLEKHTRKMHFNLLTNDIKPLVNDIFST